MVRTRAGAGKAPAGPRYSARDLKAMNGTARSSGAVGRLPVAAAFVARLRLGPGTRVLDYGAGPQAKQARWLRRQHRYWNVTAWDIGANFDPAVHDRTALGRQYDVVLASNVLNIQPGMWELRDTLEELAGLVGRGGMLVANYPSSPRRMPFVSTEDLRDFLASWFDCRVTRLPRGIFVCRK